MTKIWVLLLLFFTTLLYPQIAHAYIDPGTGGLIFQLLFAIFAAIMAGLVFFKHQVKRFFNTIKGVFVKAKEEEKGSPEDGKSKN